jgi:hypothetical protein
VTVPETQMSRGLHEWRRNTKQRLRSALIARRYNCQVLLAIIRFEAEPPDEIERGFLNQCKLVHPS